MPQDAYHLYHISRDLNRLLAGGRVNRIIQPSRDEVHLILYTGKCTVRLVLNANASDCGAYLSEEDAAAPKVAPNFCMLLRKYLQGAEITGVEIPGFERILRFSFFGSTEFETERHTLCLEVMGKYSNLVLLGEDETILGALKTTSLDTSTKRMIFPGVPSLPPAPQEGKVSPADEDALREMLSHASGDLADFLFSHVAGLAPVTAASIAETFTGGDLTEHVLAYLFSDMVCPSVLELENRPLDFFAHGTPDPRFCDLLSAENFVYAKRRAKRRFDEERRKLSAALSAAVKKQEKRLTNLLEKKKECAACEELRLKGELLTANLYALARGMRSCTLSNWYDEGNPVKVALDERLTPAENAQSYFKRYRKQKRTLEMLAPQEEETRRELDYLASLSAALSSAETEEDLLSLAEEFESAGLLKVQEWEKKKAPVIPYRTYEYMGFSVYAGRNNLQNDRLVRSASPDDLWLHVRRYHSAHVIIRTEGKKVPQEVRQFAANICAKFSESSEDRVPVDICLVKFVKKPKGSKAGFVTYTDFGTLAGDPKQAP